MHIYKAIQEEANTGASSILLKQYEDITPEEVVLFLEQYDELAGELSSAGSEIEEKFVRRLILILAECYPEKLGSWTEGDFNMVLTHTVLLLRGCSGLSPRSRKQKILKALKGIFFHQESASRRLVNLLINLFESSLAQDES